MVSAEPSLEGLFQAHRQGLAGAVRSVLGSGTEVAEVLQDAFLRCWRTWQKDPRPADPVAWIFVVTWNVAVDARRRQQRRPAPAALHEVIPMQPSTDTAPPQALEQQEDLHRAQAAIERLADPEKQVFLLRVSGGLSFAAVASALAIPEGTAKTRMRTALQRLRRALGVAPDVTGDATGDATGSGLERSGS
jgi:RNA polymerase sigma-70 factor (ECF subfamily)